MLEILFTNIGLTKVLELVAALVATFSYTFIKESRTKTFKFLLAFLWLTVSVEFIGLYTRLVIPYCFEDILFFKKHPDFLKNYWIYNIYLLITYPFYSWYFSKHFISKNNYRTIFYITTLFLVVNILNFIIGDIFFTEYSKLISLSGLILIIIVLIIYYFEILKSDRILSITNSLPFYMSVGVLIFYVSITPLMLSSQFFVSKETVFVEYYRMILNYANYFLYGIIIFGIVKCYWFKKLQSTKFSSSPTLS